MSQPEIVFVLVSLRSLFNVGSIFRTADAIGASKLYLAGYTGTPKQTKMAKTSLGAEKTMPWEKVASISKLLTELRQQKFEIIGLERTEASVDFQSWKPKTKTALLIGNEVTGLSPRVLKQCDLVVHLPMAGLKESLNVGVATGAISYYWLTRTHQL